MTLTLTVQAHNW